MTTTGDPITSTAVLGVVRAESSAMIEAEVRRLHAVLEWCAIHQTSDEETASFGDHGIPLAGDGAPCVSEFAVMELASVLGMSYEAGRRYVGRVLEVRYRLPRIWERVTAGDLPFWKAGQIAEQTMALCEDGAGFVDDRLWHVAHKVGPTQLLRLVEEAMVRFDPELAEVKRRAASDGRRFDVHTRQVSINGTVDVTGTLDLRDALDLEDAIKSGAQALVAAGCGESLDVRRSIAAGDLARGAQTLDLAPAQAHKKPRKRVLLHVHLSEAALGGYDDSAVLGRVEETHTAVMVATIRAWISDPDADLTVLPVRDLAEHVHVTAYEVPDRLVDQAAEVNQTCVFPWCTKPASRCDCDHIVPAAERGTTCSCNIAPLCRGHHRAKTHGGWSYVMVDPGTYLWRSPHGIRHRRDHHGTTPIDPAEPDS